MTEEQQAYYNAAREGGAESWGDSEYERGYQSWKAGGKGRGVMDRYGGYVDSSGMYHGPPDGTVSAGGSWVWQSGTPGFQTDGTYANGIWVGNPDAPAGMCGKGPKPAIPVNEEAIWKDILEDWVESHPNDPVAQWIFSKGQRVSKQGQKRRDWMGRGRDTGFTPPSWIGEAGLGITGEPTQEITESSGWGARRKPVYEEVPGEIESLRPMGGQLSLTADQMEQLMYYYGWLETGQPSTAKGWLQAAAYRMPNKWSDYLAQSRAAMPTKAPPKAQISAAWQR